MLQSHRFSIISSLWCSIWYLCIGFSSSIHFKQTCTKFPCDVTWRHILQKGKRWNMTILFYFDHEISKNIQYSPGLLHSPYLFWMTLSAFFGILTLKAKKKKNKLTCPPRPTRFLQNLQSRFFFNFFLRKNKYFAQKMQ